MMKKILFALLLTVLSVWVFFPEIISHSRPLLIYCNGEFSSPAFSENKSIPCEKPILNALFSYSPTQIDLENANYKAPSLISGESHTHYLGTDEIGRDTLAGVVYGFSSSMKIGLGASVIAFVIGLFFAISTGYYYEKRIIISYLELLLKLIIFAVFAWLIYYFSLSERLLPSLIILGCSLIFWYGVEIFFRNRSVGPHFKFSPDLIMLRIADGYELLPNIMLLLVFFSFFKWNVVSLAILLGLVAWPFFYRNIRIQVLRIKALPFVVYAELNGIPKYRIWFSYIMPQVLPIAISFVPFVFIAAVMSESALGFIGLGLGPDDITLGKMISEGRNFPQAWWLMWIPVMCLSIAMFALTLIGKYLAKKWQMNK